MAIYLVIVSITAWRHELFRDEVRALLIAHRATSLRELFATLHNEGHPPLWYLILRGASSVAGLRVLKPVAISIAAVAVYLLLQHSPFAQYEKLLFVFGALPLYEYSVMCRNYGITMLLLFVLAILWRNRFVRPLPVAIVLALLANSSAHGLILTGAILVMLCLEYVITRHETPRIAMVIPYAVTIAAMAVSTFIMIPDRTSTVTGLYSRQASSMLGSLAVGLVVPLDFLRPVVGVVPEIALTLLFLIVAVALLERVWLVVALAVSAAMFTFVSQTVYGTQLRHAGLYYAFLLFVLWIREDSEPCRLSGRVARMQAWGARHQRLAFGLLLAAFIPRGLGDVDKDIWRPRSSSEALGELLENSPELQGAIVLSVTPIMTEALPYYADNRIYLPREGGFFRTRVDFTSRVPHSMDLEQVNADADRLRAGGTPVVVVMSYGLPAEGPFTIDTHSYGQVLAYSPESRARFFSHARLLAKFDGAYTDENYSVYAWN
jgi:hypothetical protein